MRVSTHVCVCSLPTLIEWRFRDKGDRVRVSTHVCVCSLPTLIEEVQGQG